MAKITVDVVHKPTNHKKQIELSISDDVLSCHLSKISEFIKDKVTEIDSDFIIIRFSLVADRGISWQ